jgi:hypothetical protein
MKLREELMRMQVFSFGSYGAHSYGYWSLVKQQRTSTLFRLYFRHQQQKHSKDDLTSFLWKDQILKIPTWQPHKFADMQTTRYVFYITHTVNILNTTSLVRTLHARQIHTTWFHSSDLVKSVHYKSSHYTLSLSTCHLPSIKARYPFLIPLVSNILYLRFSLSVTAHVQVNL